MEFVRGNGRLETLLKWHMMGERPEVSGFYLAIWHTPKDTYEVSEHMYSKKYDEWCVDDRWSEDEVKEHNERPLTIKESELVAWYTQDFTECWKEGEEF